MEFSADREFSKNYLDIRESLLKQGWKESTPNRDGRMISSLFTRDGYGVHVLYGCEEDVKDEIL